MVVLVDTNVVLDYISKREPYAADAYKIVELCTRKKIDGCIAAHTITNLFFILRKELSEEKRRTTLLKMCRIFTVVNVDSSKLISALNNDKFSDLEDCLQDECANEFNSDYLITRNLKDFANSKVKAIEPSEFLRISAIQTML